VKSRRTRRAAAVAVAAVIAAAVFAGCGTESYPNDPRPPAILTVSVLIGEQEIVASPKDFGAGPTRFVVTNQTGTRQVLTVSSDRIDRDAAIDPQQTADFKVDTEPGTVTLDTDKSAADPVEITVGPKRASAQQDLDQP
jgi:hypothetical protein